MEIEKSGSRNLSGCLELVLTRLAGMANFPHLCARRGCSRRIVNSYRRLGSDRPTWKAGIVGHSSSILVVDGPSETTEVLRAVFEPRGHAVNRVRQSQLPTGSSPRVVVWHTTEAVDATAADRFAGIPRVLIGRTRVTAPSSDTRLFAQPFNYCDLLREIESLLSADEKTSGC